MVRLLERVVPAVGERPGNAGEDHPMRRATRLIAFGTGGWTTERRAEVHSLFDQLAPEWSTRASEPRIEVVSDAFTRGGPIDAGTWIELGSGTGLLSPWLAERCERLVAVDLVASMLALAPAGVGMRVQADGVALPVPDGALDALVLINAFLFPEEARRALGPAGVVVWVNTAGNGTPIYLSADDVADALGAGWDGVAAEAGHGTWAVLGRSARPGGGLRDGREQRGEPAA